MNSSFVRVLRLIGMVIFCLGLGAIILFAEGYVYDGDDQEIVRKSVIVLKGGLNDATVLIDGKEVSVRNGEVSEHVFPGLHSLSVTRPGAFAWDKKILVSADTVVTIPPLYLMRKDFRSLRLIASKGWEWQSSTSEGFLMQHQGFKALLFLALTSKVPMTVIDLPFEQELHHVIRLKSDLFMGIDAGGFLSLYEGDTHKSSKTALIARDLFLTERGPLLISKDDLLILLNTDGTIRKTLAALPRPHDSVTLLQEFGGNLLLRENGDQPIVFILNEDGAVTFMHPGESAFFEDGKIYFTQGRRLTVYDLATRRTVRESLLTSAIQWMSRVGATGRMLFINEHNDLLLCDDDGENCISLGKVEQPHLTASADREFFFGFQNGSLSLFNFGDQQGVQRLLQGLVSFFDGTSST